MTDSTPPELLFGLGGIPSPDDPRDRVVGLDELDMAEVLPRRYIVPGMGPVLNQGASPRCGGYSGVGLKQHQEKRDQHGVLAFDPHWLYTRARIHDGLDAPRGTTARGVLKALQKDGARLTGQPGTEATYRIRSYAAVPWTAQALKQAMRRTEAPLLVGTAWYRSWFSAVVLPRPSLNVGGHLWLLIGWDDGIAGGAFIGRNSWGEYPPTNGNFYAPTRYFFAALHDAWTAVDIRTG